MKDQAQQSGQPQQSAPSAPVPWHMVGIAATVCVGLTVGAFAIGVRPLLDQHRRETSQQETLKERTATASELAVTVAGLNRDLADVKDTLAKTPLRLQSATLVNQRLEALARLASECGVSLDEMRPGSPIDGAHYQTVPIRIVGGGTYPACTTFLRRLRKTFGDMGIRTFNAANTTPASPTPSASFQSELVWFTDQPHK